MEKRITKTQKVLDENGHPNPGWASRGILEYERNSIRAPFYRIKEWDWYQVSDDRLALQFTYGHASYAGQVGIMLFDFIKGENIFIKDIIIPLPFSRMDLEKSAETDSAIIYDKKDFYLKIEKKSDIRTIECRTSAFESKISMKQTNPNSLVLNVPFDENPKAFYYNQKISCMQAEGYACIDGISYDFNENAWGLLDWGRGVWPFHNEWYWSSASGYLNNEIFGVNLGCGFGNTRAASENCIFYKYDMHKLGEVTFKLGNSYDDPWHFKDKEGRLDLTMVPSYDRETKIKLLWVDNNTHQMFGKFSGHVILDDGNELTVNDITGFAEHAVNNW